MNHLSFVWQSSGVALVLISSIDVIVFRFFFFSVVVNYVFLENYSFHPSFLFCLPSVEQSFL